MSNAAYGGKSFKARAAVSGERPNASQSPAQLFSGALFSTNKHLQMSRAQPAPTNSHSKRKVQGNLRGCGAVGLFGFGATGLKGCGGGTHRFFRAPGL